MKFVQNSTEAVFYQWNIISWSGGSVIGVLKNNAQLYKEMLGTCTCIYYMQCKTSSYATCTCVHVKTAPCWMWARHIGYHYHTNTLLVVSQCVCTVKTRLSHTPYLPYQAHSPTTTTSWLHMNAELYKQWLWELFSSTVLLCAFKSQDPCSITQGMYM